MSFLSDLDGKSEIFEPEVEPSFTHGDVKKKFGVYRSTAEEAHTKYNETKGVLDRLREELQVSRDMEKSQRIRISSLQIRLSALEEKAKKLYEISEKQQNNSDQIRKIDSNIISITNVVQELKEKFKTVISSTVKEIDVIRENGDLRSVLAAKEGELDELRSELKSVIGEKEVLIKKYETENTELRKEVEISKSQASNTKTCYDSIITTYKQKIFEYERTIAKMEEERKSILGDYDLPQGQPNATAGTHHNDKAVTWPDSTVSCATERRDNTQSMDVDLTLNTCQGHGSSQSKPNLPQNRTTAQFSEFRFKHKPKLQFLDSTNEVTAVYTQPQPKKRLFSQNSNNYIN